MKESILEVKNLHFAYDEHHTVLDGISLSVFAGERIAILGSNGAGKSTFFLNLNGVLTPAEGEISYRGTKITRKTLKNCVSISVLSFRIPIIRSLLLPFSLKSLLVL